VFIIAAEVLRKENLYSRSLFLVSGTILCQTLAMTAHSVPSNGELISQLADAGLAVSSQRVALLASLIRSGGEHPTADGLYQALQDQFPTLSRATVYNNLSALVAAGLIERIDTHDGSRFGPVPVPHINLICDNCGSVDDALVGHDILARVQKLALDEIEGFRPSHLAVTLSGFCKSCRG
jgi:Fe2+ or Zn2+ uptake regulation protein